MYTMNEAFVFPKREAYRGLFIDREKRTVMGSEGHEGARGSLRE